MVTVLSRSRTLSLIVALMMTSAAAASADEIWIPPTAQADTGGIGVASSGVWPASPYGATRFAFGVPNNLQTFQAARILVIPNTTSADGSLNVIVCRGASGDGAVSACGSTMTYPLSRVANTLVDVDISSALQGGLGTAGQSYLSVLAFTTPNTTADRLVGLRFSYLPVVPAGAALLGSNTFTGTQTAAAFVGDGSGLTNLPFPAGAATLGSNVFTGTQTATKFVGDGSGLTNLPGTAGSPVQRMGGRVVLTTACGGFCTSFRFRPEGYTPAGESQNGSVADLPIGETSTFSNLVFRMSVAPPAGQVFQPGFFTSDGTAIYCQINAPATSCTVPGPVTVAAGFVSGFIDTSYAENRGISLYFNYRRAN